MEFGVPFSFLLVLVFMLCAVVSPLVAAGIIWALCMRRWRYAGGRSAKGGGILAVMFIMAYFGLHALLGQDTSVQPLSVAVAGGAGFTAGALGACAWVWMRVRRGLATTN
jgi:cytochrome c oxidase assembly factor CtaG